MSTPIRWNIYEISWLLVFSSIALVLSILWKNSLFDFSVFLSGVLCVVLAAKGHIWTYGFGMYNSFAYAYLAYTNGLYGEMGLNLFFFVPMNIVGYLLWKPKLDGTYVRMRALIWRQTLLTVLANLLGIAIMGYFLAKIPGQNTPYIDATTNVLSIVATILMVFRYREQWLLYILLNIFTVLMWSIRTAEGSPEGPLMIVMWSAYLINAGYGYYTWNRGAKQNSLFV
ncbi:MAG TPA: nicotinamide riboside transporter PnuC [Haliscomenobacter sp.]|uniref:nicotinamide riboside transporter PnuC n=1 Tax=Haliscomenobacter sp. TaxID=2717303 RepID=UPI002B8E4012|nr:nicotinamide riboside transporter PnuC [Haliscomenobacter sp.]HOY19121.1 nicotinamide riboside transporter PnuC [Haliscomenobacter sp.]